MESGYTLEQLELKLKANLEFPIQYLSRMGVENHHRTIARLKRKIKKLKSIDNEK